MGQKLKVYATFNRPEGGGSETFGPGDELPEWVDTTDFPDEVLEGGDDADEAHDNEEVSGPGQVGPPETEEERAERVREADRNRKASKRAADKKAAEDAAALKAAEEAEAKRVAEEEAARKAAEGGGS
jgi:hypothetical protein